MEVTKPTTTIPYMPRITDKILPNVVVTETSPKPIVVITEKQYQSESTKLTIPGSTKVKYTENKVIKNINPINISIVRVLLIIFINESSFHLFFNGNKAF